MPRKFTTPPPLPEWYFLMAPDGNVSAREFAKLCGISIDALYHRIERGQVPTPTCNRLNRRNPNYYWKASVVRRHMQDFLRTTA